MTEIIADCVEGCRYDVQPSSVQFTRVFYIGGISPTIDALVQVFNSGGANGVNIPYMTQVHPTIAGLVATGFSCVPVKDKSRTGVMLYVYYCPEWTIEICGDNSDDLVSQWPAGSQLAEQPIRIAYQPGGGPFTLPINGAGLNFDPATNGGIFYDFAQVPVLNSKINLRFTHITGVSPLSQSKIYRGKLNLTTWQGGQPKTWMCRAIDGVSVPQPWGFSLWRTVLEFSFDPDGWQTEQFVIMRETGKPPPDAYWDPVNPQTGNGAFLIPDGPLADFNGLGLPNAL